MCKGNIKYKKAQEKEQKNAPPPPKKRIKKRLIKSPYWEVGGVALQPALSFFFPNINL